MVNKYIKFETRVEKLIKEAFLSGEYNVSKVFFWHKNSVICDAVTEAAQDIG